MNLVTLHTGQTVTLHPRKFRKVYRRGSISQGMKAEAALPPIPAAFNWSKNHTLGFPMLGNDQAGDCVETDGAHLFEALTGCNGAEATFTTAQVLGIYSLLTGYNPANPATDRGTDPDAFFAWLKTGPGYPGGYKILDDIVINSADKASMAAFLHLFGPLSLGASLSNKWVANPHPGQVWDAAPANPMNGHEFLLTGRVPGGWDGETWGFNPPIKLTDAGLDSCQPVVTATFCLSWFNAQGIAPNGLSYDTLASFWVQMGGSHLPPFTPTPPPGPTPSPTPPAPSFSLTFRQPVAKGKTISFAAPVLIPAGKYDVVPHGTHPAEALTW